MAHYEKNPFIYDRTTGEKIPVSKEVRDEYYREVARIRMTATASFVSTVVLATWLLWTFPSVKMARIP